MNPTARLTLAIVLAAVLAGILAGLATADDFAPSVDAPRLAALLDGDHQAAPRLAGLAELTRPPAPPAANDQPATQLASLAATTYQAPPLGVRGPLASLNARRQARGRRPYQYDPRLQQLAQAEADALARRHAGRYRTPGHQTGCPSPARAAGTGIRQPADPSGRFFNSCYADATKYTHAGAATRTVGNVTYYALMVR